jgi:hypothetical protein
MQITVLLKLWHGFFRDCITTKKRLNMKTNSIQKARQAILNEIATTLEHIAYLRAQANGSLNKLIKREELKQRYLMFKLSLLEA